MGNENGKAGKSLIDKEVLLEAAKKPLSSPKPAARSSSQSSSNAKAGEQKDPGWMLGVKKSLRLFYWVAGITILWLLVEWSGFLRTPVEATINFIFSIGLFVLAIPTGLFVGMSSMFVNFSESGSTHYALLAALPIVLLNFMIVGAYRGWATELKAKKAEKLKEKK